MTEVQFPLYRDYVASRVGVNDAMTALLAGSRLASHTLSLTTGSKATLAELFPAVQHIERFNLRSDTARDLLANADHHLASVAVPYALATHEDFVLSVLDLLSAEGRTLVRHGKPIRAWNMHTILFETCGTDEPVEWMQCFHVLREMRNCITHEGGAAGIKFRDAIAAMDQHAKNNWERLTGEAPGTIGSSDSLILTAKHIFAAFAVTKRLGREVNRVLQTELDKVAWARVAVDDFASSTEKVKNSSSWRRSLLGFVRQYYSPASLTEEGLEQASRDAGLWTKPRWE